jgi:hypothetical protein
MRALEVEVSAVTVVTRRALRVYTALSALQPGQLDVLDALLPFFEPVLEVMDGKLFEPRLFALGVQKLYRWRFTTDIATQLIPRLVKAGYLEERASSQRGRQAAYIVRFKASAGCEPIDEVLKEIIDEFEAFSPRLTDLLHYTRTREELTDILIRFLVSLDAYNPTTFGTELARLRLDEEDTRILGALKEGGEPLPNDDRYMAARFVQYICEKRADAVPNLARLASIGLLTEVVEDFVKPVAIERRASLTIAIDGPLALDFLGCSGTAIKNDVQVIFDALRSIGCKLVVFPVTCSEIRRNLTSMLVLPDTRRHGPTHQAMVKGEVTREYVQAVANDPERALEQAQISVLSVDLNYRPDTIRFFTKEQYEDYFSSITWVSDVAPREHDATCLALSMRLRAGRHRGDIFQCGFIFATRNPRFVQHSRQYCLSSKLLYETQENAVIHQRELATVAWLRTGLGVAERIPRGQLMAACDRVLRVRTEVRDAVAERLKQFTPDKIEQFELLIRDHRSLRRLADQTLNNESVVTSENATELLEAMRQATIEEEKKAFEENLERERSKNRKARAAQTAETKRIASEAAAVASQRDDALEVARSLRASREGGVLSIASWTNRTVRMFDWIGTGAVLLIALGAISNYATGWLTSSPIWSIWVAGVLGLFAVYHGTMNALERPKVGLASLLNLLARVLFKRRLANAQLSDMIVLERVEFKNGRITVPPEAFPRAT